MRTVIIILIMVEITTNQSDFEIILIERMLECHSKTELLSNRVVAHLHFSFFRSFIHSPILFLHLFLLLSIASP